MEKRHIIGLHEGGKDDYVVPSGAAAQMFAALSEAAVSAPKPITTVEEMRDTLGGASFIAAVMLQRLAAVAPGFRVDPLVVLWFVQMAKTPGKAVMYAYTLFRMTVSQGEPMTFTKLITETPFMHGVPTETFAEKCWDSQKGAKQIGGNQLDTVEAWT